MSTTRAGDIQTARILAAALMTGPFMLWAIGWFLTSGGATTMNGQDPVFSPGVAFIAWAIVAAGAFASSLFARRSALGRVGAGEKSGMFSLLIVSWALLEGSAILSGVFFLLVGLADLVYWGAATLAFGMYLTFPREAWFS